MPNPHPAVRRTAQLTRRDRRHSEAMESWAVMAHRDIQLRRSHAEAQILADTSVTHVAMAAAAGTAAYGTALRDFSPEASEVLRFLEAKHAAIMAQRMDEHSQG